MSAPSSPSLGSASGGFSEHVMLCNAGVMCTVIVIDLTNDITITHPHKTNTGTDHPLTINVTRYNKLPHRIDWGVESCFSLLKLLDAEA